MQNAFDNPAIGVSKKVWNTRLEHFETNYVFLAQSWTNWPTHYQKHLDTLNFLSKTKRSKKYKTKNNNNNDNNKQGKLHPRRHRSSLRVEGIFLGESLLQERESSCGRLSPTKIPSARLAAPGSRRMGKLTETLIIL